MKGVPFMEWNMKDLADFVWKNDEQNEDDKEVGKRKAKSYKSNETRERIEADQYGQAVYGMKKDKRDNFKQYN